MAKQWIAGAIRHPGALTAQAKAAGQSISTFCKNAKSTTAKRRCSLRKTLMGFKKK
jgi:hypothetical protein